MFKYLNFLFMLFYSVHGKHEEYDGHSLYEVKVNYLEQVEQLMIIVENLNLDIWSYAAPGREGMILVPQEMKSVFEENLSFISAEYKVDATNIKEKIEIEENLLVESFIRSSFNSPLPGLSFDVIHRYAVVDRYLTDIANKFPNRARVVSAGRSFQGRDIKYLRISSNNFQDTRKPVVFIQALLHAREWATLPVPLFAIEKLVINVTEHDLIKDVDWIILPIANPDGYEFSHTNSRFWRKNRATGFGACAGVDLNRNYAFNWGTTSSNSPCSETFHGRNAFSEPETQITRDILNQFASRTSLFIDVHSFGSLILFGYGNRTLPPNSLILSMVGAQMAQRIDAVKWNNHPNYKVGNTASILYLVSGGCSDYAQVRIGSGLSYTYEVPAHRNLNNLNGFLIDPAFIRQAGFETWEGIKVAARYVARNRKSILDEW